MADTRCKELADRGQAEYQAQQYEAAQATLRDAYALQPVSWLLFNIGRIHQKLGRTDEALIAYRTFLDHSQAADESLQRQKARAYVEQIDRERAAQQQPAAAQATVAAPLVAPISLPTVPPPIERKPIYKRWWLWTIVGGAAAVVAVGTAIGLLAREPDLSDIAVQHRLFRESP